MSDSKPWGFADSRGWLEAAEADEAEWSKLSPREQLERLAQEERAFNGYVPDSVFEAEEKAAIMRGEPGFFGDGKDFPDFTAEDIERLDTPHHEPAVSDADFEEFMAGFQAGRGKGR